ncbi:MAG: GldG family protein [Isosphaeraceae bacterium]
MIEKVLTWLSRGEVWVVGAGIATFLVLTWVLRGAVPGKSVEGESDGDSPRGVHPDRIVIGVAFGLILILAGAAVAIGRGIPWSLPIFAAGFGLVLFLIRVNRRHRHTSPTVRRTIEVSSSFLDLTLLAGILVVVNVLVFRYGGRPLDMTSEGAYSLLKLSVDQINALDRPLTFIQVAGRGPLAEPYRPRVRQLLEAYQAVRPDMIQIHELNPYEDLEETEELAKRVPEIVLLRGGGVIIEYGDEESTPIVVRNQELFDLPNIGEINKSDRFDRKFRGEDAITSALLRLREGKTVKIAFTVGHGEPKLDDTGAGGLADWRARLVRVGYKPVELHLVENEIAEDVALLVVAGPVDPFKPAEVQRIRAYAERGGPVLLLLSNQRESGLEELLKANNLELGKGRVLDPRANYNGDWQIVLAASRSGVDHPISAAMAADRSVVLPYAGPIHILGMSARAGGGKPGDPVDRNLVPTPILQTGRTSWVESDMKNPRPTLDRSTDDEPGPVTVGVAVARRKGTGPPAAGRTGAGAAATEEDQPRLVLFSCPTMAINQSHGISPANLDLLMNAAGWLRGSPSDTLGISPHTHTALTLIVDPVLRQRLIVVPSFTAILSIIAMGIIIYVARRE